MKTPGGRKVLLRIASLFALMLPIAALGACGGSNDTSKTASPAAATTSNGGIPAALTTVTISDNKFTPVALQIPVGATVTWNWTGLARHSVKGTFDGQEVNSPTLSGTGVFLFAFQKAGIFEYECGIHGAAMKGTITIQ
ncbi:MAG: hypothetical protein ABI577_01085 [bacterium]